MARNTEDRMYELPMYLLRKVATGELTLAEAEREALAATEPKEHDPTECGCRYIAFGMWDCGHTDQH